MRILFISLMALIMSTGVFAQQKTHMGMSTEERAKTMTNRLYNDVKLDPAKKESITAAFNEYYTQMQITMDKKNIDGIQGLAKERDEKIKKIIDNEQNYQQYLSFMEKQKGMHKGQVKPMDIKK
ncbi:MAG: hypothetical protein Q8880_06150 [Bacteroidota bacterium]|nr:hypothetical protein [Bacteroidota bacterium]